MTEPLTYEQLQMVRNFEMKTNALSEVPLDLYQRMDALSEVLSKEYERQMALDPESIMVEGAEQRREGARRLISDILRLRTQKVAMMALRGATGSRNTLDRLTAEEWRMYREVMESAMRCMGIKQSRPIIGTPDCEAEQIEAVMDYLMDRGQATVAEIRGALCDDTPTSTIREHLRTLEKAGWVTKVQRGHNAALWAASGKARDHAEEVSE